jgi:chemotaxis protein MotB
MAGGGAADDKSRWLITYGDLMTLMFALFVVMYGISTADIAKFQKFKEGLGDFGNPAARDAGVLSGGGGVAGDNPPGALSEQDYGPGPREEEVEGESRAGLGAGEGQGSEWRGVHFATRDELPFIRAELEEALERLGLRGEVSFRLEERGLVTAVATDRVLFRSGSAVISPFGREIIGAIAPTLAGLTNQVLIEGHTDDVPLNGPGYNNWNLSTDRAVAVVRLLQEAFGIDPGRLVAAGYGEYRPRATNETALGRSLNRRVEFVISTEITTDADAATGVPAAEDAPSNEGEVPVEDAVEPRGWPVDVETDEEVDGG